MQLLKPRIVCHAAYVGSTRIWVHCKISLTDSLISNTRLRVKRHETAKDKETQRCQRLKDRLLDGCMLDQRNALTSSYNALQEIAKDILVSNEVISADENVLAVATVKLLEIFAFSNGSMVTERERRKVTIEFGPCANMLLKRAMEETKRLKQCFVDEETFRSLLGPNPASLASNGYPSEHASALVNDSQPFGSNVKVNPPEKGNVVDFGVYGANNALLVGKAKVNKFSIKYEAREEDTSLENDSEASLDYVYQQMNVSFSEPHHILNSTMKILKSCDSEVLLQTELYDLLGFENVDLIGYLLRNRRPLVKQFASITLERLKKAYELKQSSRPAGADMFVQAQKQKLLAKEIGKIEKKLHKFEKITDLERSEMQDVDVLRKKKLEYKAAANILSSLPMPVAPKPLDLPYVFDKVGAIKEQNPATALNSKLRLAADCVHRSSDLCQEVTIPAPAPTNFANTVARVKIADLDEMSQLAFSGFEELNLIQSIVYEQARHSNENLLICAPTGAGKTNIAMLCILRILENFTENGLLKKDDFKIVYIAPMKALAAEMVRNLGSRLSRLGVTVKELTGDMQLSKYDINRTQMLVTTPEKWDVVTRKSSGDISLSLLVRLLIIDEVHLLHDERGAVLETLVARTLRQVKTSQQNVRLVGLSATLPNYLDVAKFLCVNPQHGLFFFDARFRPVPLAQTFVGVKGKSSLEISHNLDRVCYDAVVKFVRQGHQVMVFVHSRVATSRTASVLAELAANLGHSSLFLPKPSASYHLAQKLMGKSQNSRLKTLFTSGFGIHHAGMLRTDRNMVEKLFAEGHIKVLCCTATLAWGVNLPAHAVIIKGTDIYDAKKCSFVDVGILDVQQIFGRAGRPQYESTGHGVIITAQEKLHHFLRLMTNQTTIESQFLSNLCENLNAEICLDSVCTVPDAIEWLSYTYMFVRARLNPLAYGITIAELQADPDLLEFRRCCIISAARQLERLKMIRFHEENGYFYSTDLGRIASYYYLKCGTVETFNNFVREVMPDHELLATVAKATEFENFKVRDDEFNELESLLHDCKMAVPGGCENSYGKVNILLQAYVGRSNLNTFSLISDSAFVAQNGSRILRAMFDISLRRNWPVLATALLRLCKSVEKRRWWFEHPLWQLSEIIRFETMVKIESRRLSIERLKDMDVNELGYMLRDNGHLIKDAVHRLPQIEIESRVQPITRTILRIRLIIVPSFVWDDRVHGRGMMLFHIWIVEPNANYIYHKEELHLSRKQVIKKEVQELVFTMPVTEPIPTQYLVNWISDVWIGCQGTEVLSFENLILPSVHPPHTKLIDLKPLPVTALRNEIFQSIYEFTHFNAVQTQMFFCLFHTDNNVLVGAPTGSGKTIAAELAILRVFAKTPTLKCVYIAPLKALVKERMKDWTIRLEQKLGKRVVELTGDCTPDARILATADVVVTTPEKWDGISRSWQSRAYVRDIALIVIDEIHLLGEDRGPVLEVIVSRTNYITGTTGRKVRVIGLSTALANAGDLANWLGIQKYGMYNFPPSVRPVPLEVHIAGFPEKRYCPRMATMNKPAYKDIKVHSAGKPVLIFVSSRRQTRLTSFDLIAHLVGDCNPKQWLNMDADEFESYSELVRDPNLRLSLSFGIGLHHAGLRETDRNIVEELFVTQKIQVLIATATLAWGVNFPAHLVIVKGTEYYDGKTRRYVDFPVTDVLQMIGRAGRPQYDDQGIAIVYVQDMKKNFYQKFLYEPFPVESSLLAVLPDHLNAEIVAGTISTKQQALDYITWTYFFRRLLLNPSYYGAERVDKANLNFFLSNLVDTAIRSLEKSRCVEVDEDHRTLFSRTPGRIASYYYLNHKTVKLFLDRLSATCSVMDLLLILTSVSEYDEIPVRHNEELINNDLAKQCVVKFDQSVYDDPHVKTHLLYQAHFLRLTLPCTDYETDLKSVLDQSIRIVQAMFDITAEQGWLATALRTIHLLQMIVQARFVDDPPLSMLPGVDVYAARRLSSRCCVETIPQLMETCRKDRNLLLRCSQGLLDPSQVEEVLLTLSRLPIVGITVSVDGREPGKGQSSKRAIPLSSTSYNQWLPVYAQEEYVFSITLRRLVRRNERRAVAPKFPKAKDEGWFAIIGSVETGELLAVRRVAPFERQTSTNLLLVTPSRACRVIYTLYVMSDCYIGFDQQYEVRLEVNDACERKAVSGVDDERFH
uniref:Activating signal cointegrator 1 complex subunit 3 n=1 Tax=Trichuris muris TaxID=70415 RepID=A0A5S6QU49_TRIMR